jgi:PGF-CTERM protein
MWNNTAHAAAFGESPAQFRYRLADDDPVTVEGPTRTTALSGRELAVTTGETLRVRLTVENVGGTAGDYELPFRVNETETVARGRLGPGERATHTFERTFTEPGTYQLTAGVDTFTVRVTTADSAGGGAINSTPPPVFDDDGIEGTAGNEGDNEDNATGEDTGSETGTADGATTDDNAPGFGVGVAVAALALSLVAFSRPRD